jgi:solute carrier family 25 folate transporter 32
MLLMLSDELAALMFSQLSAANRRGVRTDELSASELVVTSAFSKMVASTITYPHEVVRSYMHVTGAA